MGSWNETCGVSQISIPEGSNVRVFLILQSEFGKKVCGSGTCYSSGYFRPWFFPVKAKYNSYGSVEDIEDDWNSQYIFSTFKKWLSDGTVKLLGKESEVNDPGIREFNKIDQIFDCVERGSLIFRVEMPEWDSENKSMIKRESWLKIGLFMVLEPVYNSLVQEFYRVENLPEKHYWKKSSDEERQNFINYIKLFRSEFEKRDINFDDPLIKNLKELRRLLFDGNRYLGDRFGERSCFEHYEEFIVNPNSIPLDIFVKRADEVNGFCQCMSSLRKMWIPQCGKGSQSEELAFTKALISGMNAFIQQREEELRLDEESWKNFQNKSKGNHEN